MSDIHTGLGSQRHGEPAADLTIADGQPFRLDLLHRMADLLDPHDPLLLEACKAGVDIGTNEMLHPSGLWPLAHTECDTSKFDPDHQFETRDDNCRSMAGDLFELAKKELDKDLVEGFAVNVDPAELPRVEAQGLLACIDEGLQGNGERKVRVVWGGTILGPNKLIRLYEAQELPHYQRPEIRIAEPDGSEIVLPTARGKDRLQIRLQTHPRQREEQLAAVLQARA